MSTLFEIIRNSVSSKILTASALMMLACGSPSEDPGKSFVNGVKIHIGKTDHEGKVYFTDFQTEEEVEITVYENEPVPDASVTFIDGNEFEIFITNHPDYLRSLEPFAHNSSHNIKLKRKSIQFTKFDQYRFENPNDEFIVPMNKFVEWGKESALEYVECQTRDEFINNYTDTLSIISNVASAGGASGTVDKFFSIMGKSVDYVLKASDLIELEETEIVHLYRSNKMVADFGSLIEGSFYQLEICGDGIDNDCDGYIDKQDNDCLKVSCDEQGVLCLSGKITASISTCDKIYNARYCEDNKTCIGGLCYSSEELSCEYDKDICTYLKGGEIMDVCGKTIGTFECTTGYTCKVDRCVKEDSCDYVKDVCIGGPKVGQLDSCGDVYPSYECPQGEVCDHVNDTTVCKPKWTPPDKCNYVKDVCVGNELGKKNDCDQIYDLAACPENTKCIEDICVENDNPDCSFSHKTCYDNNTKASVDTCGNTYNKVDCNSDEYCSQGSCVDDKPTCYFVKTVCSDSDTKADKDTCGDLTNFVNCPDECSDGSCVDSCDFKKNICYDSTSIGWEDTCGNKFTSVGCQPGDVCVDAKCVDDNVEDLCNPLPKEWFPCACPNQHGVQCHHVDAYSSCD